MAARKNRKKYGETFGCMMCGFTTTDIEAQARHWLKEHWQRAKKEAWPGEPPHRCLECGEGFRTPEGLSHHMDERHQGIIGF